MSTAANVFALFTTPRAAPPREATETALLAQGRRTAVPYRDGRLAAWTWGEAGTPVLLVHGWESRASHFGVLIQRLLRAGYQVTAYDAPAHGESDGQHSDPVDFGRALLAVDEALGPFGAVVAHSVGSAAAQYAFAHGLQTGASVHIAGPASLVRALQRLGHMAGLPEEEFPELRRLVEARIGEPLEHIQVDALRAGMTHPALLLHDPEDRQVPFTESRALHEIWPDSSLEPVPGAGHARILGAPAVVERIAGFLDTAGDGTHAAETVGTGRAS